MLYIVFELFKFLLAGEVMSGENKQAVDAGLHVKKRETKSIAEKKLPTKTRNEALGAQRVPVIIGDKEEIDNENLFPDKEAALKVCFSFTFICFLVLQLKGRHFFR